MLDSHGKMLASAGFNPNAWIVSWPAVVLYWDIISVLATIRPSRVDCIRGALVLLTTRRLPGLTIGVTPVDRPTKPLPEGCVSPSLMRPFVFFLAIMYVGMI